MNGHIPSPPDAIDPSKVHSEICLFLRHYSTLSHNLRTMSVIQTLTLFGIWANMVFQSSLHFRLIIVLPIVGMIFTLLLLQLHLAYFKAAEFYVDELKTLEEKLFGPNYHPTSAYYIWRKQNYSSPYKRYLSFHAPYTLGITLFGAALIEDLVLWCR